MGNENQNRRHTSPEGIALQTHLRSRVVRLLNWTKPNKGGTAVKIRLGDRHFLATAAHVVPEKHKFRAIVPGPEANFVNSFMNRVRDTSTDVALLELSQEGAKQLGGSFVSAEEIHPGFDHTPSPAIVVGYPGQLIHSADRQILADCVEKVHDFRTIYFVTATLPISEWPTRLERPPTAEYDVFASFEPGPVLQKLKLNDLSLPPEDIELDHIDLKGVSGGGIWLETEPPGDREIWHPRARLIALDIAVGDDWLRGTKIDNWLKLVTHHYPDLTEVIDSIQKQGNT